MMRKRKRDEAYNKARKQYRGALLTILGDKNPDVAELIEKHGIAFALRVLRVRGLNK